MSVNKKPRAILRGADLKKLYDDYVVPRLTQDEISAMRTSPYRPFAAAAPDTAPEETGAGHACTTD